MAARRRHARRRQSVRRHLAAAPLAEPQPPLSMHLLRQMALPRQLEQDDSGALLPEDVRLLEQLEAEAVAKRDYR